MKCGWLGYGNRCNLYEHREPCIGDKCGILDYVKDIEKKEAEIVEKDTEIRVLKEKILCLLRLGVTSENCTIYHGGNTIFEIKVSSRNKIRIFTDIKKDQIEKYFVDCDWVEKKNTEEDDFDFNKVIKKLC